MLTTAQLIYLLLNHMGKEQIQSIIAALNNDELLFLQTSILPSIEGNELTGFIRKLVLDELSWERIEGDENRGNNALNPATYNKMQERLLNRCVIEILSKVNHENLLNFLSKRNKKELQLLLYIFQQELYSEEAEQVIITIDSLLKKLGPKKVRSSELPGLSSLGGKFWEHLAEIIDTQKKEAIKAELLDLEEHQQKKILQSRGAVTYRWPRLIHWLERIAHQLFWSAAEYFSNKNKITPQLDATERTSISAKEESAFKKMVASGQASQHLYIDKDKVGRSTASRERLFSTRFGISHASQVGAGIGKDRGRSIFTVASSIAEKSDGSKEIAQLSEAINGVTLGKNNVLAKENMLYLGGFSYLVTLMEQDDLQQILSSKDPQKDYGVHFSEEERIKLKRYLDGLERSKNINFALHDNFNGPYENRQPIKKNFDKEMDEYKNNLKIISKMTIKECLNLPEGESLYLDTGISEHAMKIAITKKGGRLHFSCYDPAGGIENSALSEGLSGIFQLNSLQYDGKRANALRFSIPEEKLQNPESVGYFSQLFSHYSVPGQIQSDVDAKSRQLTLSDRLLNYFFNQSNADISNVSISQRILTHFCSWVSKVLDIPVLLKRRERAKVYLNFLDAFTAISDDSDPPKYDALKQHPQNTGNCFAKRAQTCQLYELGKDTYKKLRRAVLIEQRKGMEDDIFGKTKHEQGEHLVPPKYASLLDNIIPTILSPQELYEASIRFSEISDNAPSEQYYASYFRSLIDTRALLLNKAEKTPADVLTIEKIEAKLEKYASDLYLFLSSRGMSEDIAMVFAKDFNPLHGRFNWASGGLPFEMKSNGKQALHELSKYATALGFRDSLRMSYHMTEKLLVSERHIRDEHQRLASASYLAASLFVTLNDLQQANIVTFTTGIGRKQQVKVELNVNGQRKEVGKLTFLRLVAKNPKALTDPTVIRILDYLRTISQEVEQEYETYVYTPQKKAFQQHLGRQITQARQSVNEGQKQLKKYLDEAIALIEPYEKEQERLFKLISIKGGAGSKREDTADTRVLRARLEQVNKDITRLKSMQNAIEIEIKALQLDAENDIQKNLSQSIAMFNAINGKGSEKQRAIREIIANYQVASDSLSMVRKQTQESLQRIEITKLEELAKGRAIDVNQYRENAIKQYLEENSDFLIISKQHTGLTADVDSPTHGEHLIINGIAALNEQLKEKVIEFFSYSLSRTTKSPRTKKTVFGALIDENNEYEQISMLASCFAKECIPSAIKKQWNESMFELWLKHERRDLILGIEKLNHNGKFVEAVNSAYASFILKYTGMKADVLKSSGFLHTLSKDEIDSLGWHIGFAFAKVQERQSPKAVSIVERFYAPKKKPVTPIPLEKKERFDMHGLQAPGISAVVPQQFKAPSMKFLEQEDFIALDVGTIKFLSTHPIPVCASDTKEAIEDYCIRALNYLQQMIAHQGLDNKQVRILEWCRHVSHELANQSFAPSKEFIHTFSEAFLEQYRDSQNSLDNAFMTLENNERSQLLTSLILLNLAALNGQKALSSVAVSRDYYSLLKQWARLINPPDEHIAAKMSLLKPDDVLEFDEAPLLQEADLALHRSPVGLEGLYEGQQGLQAALSVYGQLKKNQIDFSIRKDADRLLMRNGASLLPVQFLNYYKHSSMLYSVDGIHSTQGREFFMRGFIDAYHHASDTEKQKMLIFAQGIQSHEQKELAIKVPNAVFVDEVLCACYLDDLKAGVDMSRWDDVPMSLTNTHALSSYINALTSDTSAKQKGEVRLLGFAKEINFIALQIEQASLKQDSDRLNKLYAQFICANIAYNLLLEKVSDDVMKSYMDNFEYKQAMSLAKTRAVALSDKLSEFAKDESHHRTLLAAINLYESQGKFEAPWRKVKNVSCSDVTGFIEVGGNRRIDVLHGAVYVGNNREIPMPAHIRAHVSLQVLEINNFSFVPAQGRYVYTKFNKDSNQHEVKVSITQLDDGGLIIQRELPVIDRAQSLMMLQYLPDEQVMLLPRAIKNYLGAVHFFIDSQGAIHAFSKDFAPLMKITEKRGVWRGCFIDHNQEKISIILNNNPDTIHHYLSKIFPIKELITVNDKTVYIPSLKRYVVYDKHSKQYFMMDNLSKESSKCVLKIEENGLGYTEKALLESDKKALSAIMKEEFKKFRDFINGMQNSDIKNKSKKQLKRFQECLESVSDDLFVATFQEQSKLLRRAILAVESNDIVTKQYKRDLSNKVNKLEKTVLDAYDVQNFLYVPNNNFIQLLESNCQRLKKEIDDAYLKTINSSNADKEGCLNKYEALKNDYLAALGRYRKAIGEVNHSIKYAVGVDKQLVASGIEGVLYYGKTSGNTALFLKLLGGLVPGRLSPSELDELRAIKKIYESHTSITPLDEAMICMLAGIELHHQMMLRKEHLHGRPNDWNYDSYLALKEQYLTLAQRMVDNKKVPFPKAVFSKLWHEINAEFGDENPLKQVFQKSLDLSIVRDDKPIKINTKTSMMPIEVLGLEPFVMFNLKHVLITKEQKLLELQLRSLSGGDNEAATNAQIDGYYYENYGLFNQKTLCRLLCVTKEHDGVGHITESEVEKLFAWMVKEGWVKESLNQGRYQLIKHPAAFFSVPQLSAYLKSQRFADKDSQKIIERLDVFLYEAAVCGGEYSLKPNKLEDTKTQIKSAQSNYNIEMLQAEDKIKSLLESASGEVSLAELHAAYLLNDYRRILPLFPQQEHATVQTALNNALTRMLYYKTELDHMNEIDRQMQKGKVSHAISLLHVRRNYQLDLLLQSSEGKQHLSPEELESTRKMQRAFLLFEANFGNRCNARQVDIFRGLLLDDETSPEKIDAAQARMGFGKTSLLPLVALYKTGKHLVRFIVPKSALETNTKDMSLALNRLIGTRAVKDDFHRYTIDFDKKTNSYNLEALRDAKLDLIRRKSLYQRARDDGDVLLQAPNVRNSLECQAEVFINMLMSVKQGSKDETTLMECLALINDIRSISTISIFDELDATQDLNTTEVHYTLGEKDKFKVAEIDPLVRIVQVVASLKGLEKAQLWQLMSVHLKEDLADITPKNIDTYKDKLLARLMMAQLGVHDSDGSIFKYITSKDTEAPALVNPTNETAVYLMRAMLLDPALINIINEKQPSTDFGVWFDNAKDGRRVYETIKSGAPASPDAKEKPLLITVPYQAANTPKPRGSRFDNPEVTAMTTLLYYLDSRTPITEEPHVEFLIDSFKSGDVDDALLDAHGQRRSEFDTLFEELKELAGIQDPVDRNRARAKFFNTYLSTDASATTSLLPQFRMMLARMIIKEQVQIDSEKADSNRYEQGTVFDKVIGFSGTTGDTASTFSHVRADPAADGNMTLGIMGRANCQKTIVLKQNCPEGEDYTTHLISQFSEAGAFDASSTTRALIDVGGLCKLSNRKVARLIAEELNAKQSKIKNNGVIFYDDVTNTKSVLTVNFNDGTESVVELTDAMAKKSEDSGLYFTYFDQDHARGANIQQMDGANALLTLSFLVTNNDYKQAIMRMRKIIDKSSGQTFSVAVPADVRVKILKDLKLETPRYRLTGNDIACWLRQRELLLTGANAASIVETELNAVIKNAVLQKQAEITRLLYARRDKDGMPITPSKEEIEQFRVFLQKLNEHSKFISTTPNTLKSKYGLLFKEVNKQDFLDEKRGDFQLALEKLYQDVVQIKTNLRLVDIPQEEQASSFKAPYVSMMEQIITKREPTLSEHFIRPMASVLTEVQSEAASDSQSHSQSESERQTESQSHSMSEVDVEEVVGSPNIAKEGSNYKRLNIDYLSDEKAIQLLTHPEKLSCLNHLFAAQDAVLCSQSYQPSSALTPPVRYFIARNEGAPRVILLNQDEADLFMGVSHPEWSLYDAELIQKGTVIPLRGSEKVLDVSLLKKILLAAYHGEIKARDLETVADSFNGICTEEQLQPWLDISGEGVDDLFTLNQWGYAGDSTQKLVVSIRQATDGVLIDLEHNNALASLVIPARLKERILTEIEQSKAAQEEHQQPIMTQVKSNVDIAYRTNTEQVETCKTSFLDLENKKRDIAERYDAMLSELALKKAQLIKKTQRQLAQQVEKQLGLRLNKKELLLNQLWKDVRSDCNKNIYINKVLFKSLEDVLDSKCNEVVDFFANPSDPAACEAELKKLTAYLTTVGIKATEYHELSYIFKTKPYISAFRYGLDAVFSKQKKLNFNTFLVWGRTIKAELSHHFKSITEGVPGDAFDNELLECFRQSAEAYKSKWPLGVDADKFLEEIVIANFKPLAEKWGIGLDEFIAKLTHVILPQDGKELTTRLTKHLCEQVTNRIVRVFITRIDEKVKLSQLSLEDAQRIRAQLLTMINEYEFVLPQKLQPGQTPTSQEVARVMAILDNMQFVVRTAAQKEVQSSACAKLLAQYDLMSNQIFREYKSVTNRQNTILGRDGESFELSPESMGLIRQLDDAVAFLDGEANSLLREREQLDKDVQEKLEPAKLALDEAIKTQQILEDTLLDLDAFFKGAGDLLSAVTDSQVCVQESDPIEFFEAHFNLEQILLSTNESTASLTFTPPKFYELVGDIQVQKELRHGLVAEQTRSEKALVEAELVVRRAAADVVERGLHVPLVTPRERDDLSTSSSVNLGDSVGYSELGESPITPNGEPSSVSSSKL